MMRMKERKKMKKRQITLQTQKILRKEREISFSEKMQLHARV